MNISQWQQTPQATANFGLILVVLVLNGIVVHRNTIALHETQGWVVHSHDVLSQIEHIHMRILEAESSVRGYAITGDDSQLETYRQVIRTLPEEFHVLRLSVKDNPPLLEKAQHLEDETNSRLEQLRRATTIAPEQGPESKRDTITTKVVKQEMNPVHQIVEDLRTDESRLLRARTEDAEKKYYTILVANVMAVSLALLIGGVAWGLIESHVRKCGVAETKAAAERENLLVTLKSIGDAVVVTDSQGCVQLLNPAAELLLGSPAGLIGKRLLDVFAILDESTRHPVESPVVRAVESGTSIKLASHTLLVRPDGVEVPIEETASPIRNKSGEITGVILVFRDCSERWQFEAELKRREQRFRILFETPLIGIAVGTSGGKHLLEANDAYLDLIGYDVGELPGASLGWGGVGPEQSPLDDFALRELRETGVCRPFERTCKRSDGTVAPVLISATKLFDEKDRVIVFVTDLSSIKQSEAALLDSQKRFRTLAESMPQMVWTAQFDGKFDYVNQTLIDYSGRTEEELKGRGWTDLLHDEDREAHAEAWKTALSEGQPLEVEHRLRKWTGEFRWHLTRALPVYNSNNQITLWVGTNTDIHDHKLVEVLLKEEHERKDRFLALVAHELRNPLAPLANAVQIFSTVHDGPTQSRELIAIMQRQVKQMTRLIDDLLDLARITQGRILLRRERTLAATITAAAVESVHPWIEEGEHQLSVTLPTDDLWIDADAARLTQVLVNLLQNAAKYTEPKGQIILTVERDHREVLFRVRDNGPGLSPATLNRIFDLFMQVEQTLDRSRGGLGIGLTLVRTLVELHGGTVTAHSKGLGHGSEFVVRLPLIADSIPPAAEDSPNRPAATEPELPAKNVLVVDDVQASAKTLALMLSVLGQNVDMAFDGLSAIAKVNGGTFDVVFLDISMPGVDGLEVARQLRANPALKELTLVALTGFGQDDDRQRSFDAGFNEHLIKPTSVVQLREVLQRRSVVAG